jgi:prophage maintenance system killer protein
LKGEPLPPFKTRYKGVLESVIGSVQLKSEMLELNIPQTATHYYVELAKSQAFMNGNKRMSIVLTDLFLRLNGYRLASAWFDWADLTLFISELEQQSLDEIVEPLYTVFEEVVRKK